MRLAGGKDYFTEEELDEADVYFENQLSTLAEDDILSGEEEGFMMGYLAAF